jgi:hypothetical protein
VTQILLGIVRPAEGEYLWEDARDVWEMADGLRRTYPRDRWVAEDVAAAQAAQFAGLW